MQNVECKMLNAQCIELSALCIMHFMLHAFSGSNCGVKSLEAPGTLYSYGPR